MTNPAANIGIRRRLFLGFGSQTFAILLRIAQQFLLVPILIRGWGVELYADWIILFSATGFLTVLDLGLQTYFGNALLITWSRGDFTTYRRLISTAIFVYGSIVLAATAALAAGTMVVPWGAYFGIHAMSLPMAFDTAMLLAISNLVLLPCGLIGSIYRAHGDYSRGTVTNVSAEATRGLGICAVVAVGGQPTTAALIYLLATLLYGVGIIVDQWRRYGEVPLGLSKPTTAEVWQAISRSAFYLLTTVTVPLVTNAPVLLLSTLGGVSSAVIAYTVSRTFTGFMRQIVVQFSHPISAEMVRQATIGNSDRLLRMFIAAGRMVAGSAGLLGGFSLMVAGPFLRIWTHGTVNFDPVLIGTFVATVIVTAPAQVAAMLFLYNNKPKSLALAQATYAVGTLVFCLLLVKHFAALGAALGIGLAEFLSVGLILPYAAAKEIGASLIRYFVRSYSTAVGAFILSYSVAWGWSEIFAASSLVRLIELAMLWMMIIAPPSFFMLLDRQEREWVVVNCSKRLGKVKRMPSF